MCTPFVSSFNSLVAGSLQNSTGTSTAGCWAASKCLHKAKPSAVRNIIKTCQEIKYLSSWCGNYGINSLSVKPSKLELTSLWSLGTVSPIRWGKEICDVYFPCFFSDGACFFEIMGAGLPNWTCLFIEKFSVYNYLLLKEIVYAGRVCVADSLIRREVRDGETWREEGFFFSQAWYGSVRKSWKTCKMFIRRTVQEHLK